MEEQFEERVSDNDFSFAFYKVSAMRRIPHLRAGRPSIMEYYYYYCCYYYHHQLVSGVSLDFRELPGDINILFSHSELNLVNVVINLNYNPWV